MITVTRSIVLLLFLLGSTAPGCRDPQTLKPAAGGPGSDESVKAALPLPSQVAPTGNDALARSDEIRMKNEAILARLAAERARAQQQEEPQVAPAPGTAAGEPVRKSGETPRSTMDEMRERLRPFEKQLAEARRTADRLNDDVRRYRDGCQGKYTESAGIDFAIGYGIALANETSPECRMLRSDIGASTTALRHEVESIEEAARKSAVQPGLMRDLRRKYGLDW